MLSIVIPSYKGANTLKKNLPGLIKHLKLKGYNYEIIIVDDGSDDKEQTKNVCEELDCLYLKNPKNLGKGAAVKKGMLNCKGKYRIFTAVDIPFRYENIDKFIYYLDFKEFDIVVGNRTLKDSVYFGEIPYIRKITSKVFSFITGRFIITGFFDSQCGLKGFRDYIAVDIFSKSLIKGFAFDVEIIYIALKRNYDIKNLPVQIRNYDVSSIKLLKHSLKIFLDIFFIKYNQLRKKYRKSPD